MVTTALEVLAADYSNGTLPGYIRTLDRQSNSDVPINFISFANELVPVKEPIFFRIQLIFVNPQGIVVQHDIAVIHCAHSSGIELNNRREIRYLHAPMCFSLLNATEQWFKLKK